MVKNKEFHQQLEQDIQAFAETYTGVPRPADATEKKAFEVRHLDGFIEQLAATQNVAVPGSAAVTDTPLLASLRTQAAERTKQNDVAAITEAQRLREVHALVDSALDHALAYLSELVAQLNIIKPEFKGAFTVANPFQIDGFRWKSGNVSSRKTSILSEIESYDHVMLAFRRETEKPVSISKDFPICYRFREILEERGVGHERQEVRNELGFIVSMNFEIAREVAGSLYFKPDYQCARLNLVVRNVSDFEIKQYQLDAYDVKPATLDQVARHLLGELHELSAPFQKVDTHRPLPAAS